MLHPMAQQRMIHGNTSGVQQSYLDFSKIPSATQWIANRVAHTLTHDPQKKPNFHLTESQISENSFSIKVSFMDSSYIIHGTFKKKYIRHYSERETGDDSFVYDKIQYDVLAYRNDWYVEISREKFPQAIHKELEKNNFALLDTIPNGISCH
jgi:hypothetical protein